MRGKVINLKEVIDEIKRDKSLIVENDSHKQYIDNKIKEKQSD